MKKRFFLLLVVPILLCIVYLVDITFNNPGEDAPMNIGSFRVIESSSIDPGTVLLSLGDNNQRLFSFSPGFPDDPPVIASVDWKQADFLKLATSIFRVAWNEPIDSWVLYRMAFWTDCKDSPNGYSGGELYFYLETSSNNARQYSVREILMEPEYGYVAWGGDTFYPRALFSKWKSIGLREIQVNAENALKKAESSGGAESRMSANNNCHIITDMYPNRDNRSVWLVTYSAGYKVIQGPSNFWIPAK